MKKEERTQWVDLQVREEQFFIQVKESNDESGQDSAERRHSTHETYIIGDVLLQH